VKGDPFHPLIRKPVNPKVRIGNNKMGVKLRLSFGIFGYPANRFHAEADIWNKVAVLNVKVQPFNVSKPVDFPPEIQGIGRSYRRNDRKISHQFPHFSTFRACEA
jgi:hypothetical protein